MHPRDLAVLFTAAFTVVLLAVAPWEPWTVWVWFAVLAIFVVAWRFGRVLADVLRPEHAAPHRPHPAGARAMAMGAFAMAASCIQAAGLVQLHEDGLGRFYFLLGVEMVLGLVLVRWAYATRS